MTEQIRETYFLIVRVLLVLAAGIFILLVENKTTGVPGAALLLMALFFGAIIGKDAFSTKYRVIGVVVAGGIAAILIYLYGMEYLILLILTAYEFIGLYGFGIGTYCVPFLASFIPIGIQEGMLPILSFFTGLIYMQHNVVVGEYRKILENDIHEEQKLKKKIYKQEDELRSEMNRSMLETENRILEEKARLSQVLHDKLGHNINGSIYQLEAVKVLMDTETGKSREMVQGVIDSLRTGMDEIRAILRKEQPGKYKLAMLQLSELIERLSKMGVEAELDTQGDLSQMPASYWEVVLDNTFESVSNSLKYSKCTQIKISLIVMNKMVRCSVKDNGIGCENIVDGMGISGMRRRVRNLNGILDIEGEMGFTVNILLPLPDENNTNNEG